MSDCLTGCTRRGEHLTTCEGECRGCQPRAAEYGELCPWCWQRLGTDLDTVPGLVAHLRALGKPYAQAAPPSDARTYRDPAEGSILPAEWLAADELHALVTSWALLLLEEHPNGATMTGPPQSGAWVTQYGTPVGVLDPDATAKLVAWLGPFLGWCSQQEWAGVMRTELGQAVASNLARWPFMDTRTRFVPGVACVVCEHKSLTYTPTTYFRAMARIACSSPECGRVYTEAEYDGVIGRLTIERGHVA